MFRVKHVILILSLLSLGPALTACADFDADKLDIFGINEKKKLPGERRPVFPEGVPGVTQGVPPELVKGYQAPSEPEPEVAPAVAEKPKPKPRRTVTHAPKRAPAEVTVQPAQQQQQGGGAPWPDAQAPRQQPAQQPWPSSAPAQQSQQPATQWPAPPPSGTFTR